MDEQIRNDYSELFEERKCWMDSLENRKVMITGATGLVGSTVANAILFYNKKFNSNIKVLLFVRNLQKASELYYEYTNEANLSIVVGDVCDPIVYDSDLDYIIHCANNTVSKEYVDNPVETIKTILVGTNNILKFAAVKNAELIYISSMEMYGAPTDENEMTEDKAGYIDCLNVRSSYSEGKRMAECLCAAYRREYGVKFKVARLAQVFGAGVRPKDNRVFVQLAKCAIHKTPFVLHTKGESYGNYCYTADAAAAILMLLTLGCDGEAYNIVNESNCMMIKDMAATVANEVAEEPFEIEYDIPESRLKYGYAPDVKLHLSSSKMNCLGWKASVGLTEMYKRMIKSFRARNIEL